MLDLETFGTRHDAMIVQIGACYFDRMTGEIGETFFRNVRSGSYTDKFTVDYSTLKWWLQQSDEARGALFPGSVHIEEALHDLRDFLNKDGVFVWSHATFDMPILQNAFETVGVMYPVPFRNARDLRTLMDLAQPKDENDGRVLFGMIREGVHHQALDDAKYQAQYAAAAFRKLYGGA